jgi:excisionase family DNA binding protein
VAEPVETATVELDDVLTADEVAALLRVGRNAVYGLAARQEIPHRRIARAIRFSRAAVMRWLAGAGVRQTGNDDGRQT